MDLVIFVEQQAFMGKSKAPQIPDFRLTPRIDQVGVGERISRITTRSIKSNAKLQGLKMILNMIDLTTLEGADTRGKVSQLCNKAKFLHASNPDLPTVAAVCVYPNFVSS